MDKRLLFLLSCLFIYTTQVFSQAVMRPADMVNHAKAKHHFQSYLPVIPSQIRDASVPDEIKNYSILNIERSTLQNLISRNEDYIELQFPMKNDLLSVELVKVDIMRGVDYVTILPAQTDVKVDVGIHYRGILRGDDQSVVAISVFDGGIEGLIALEDKNYVIGKMADQDAHIIYEDTDISDLFELGCAVDDSQGSDYAPHELRDVDYSTRALDECVELYIEVDNDVYTNKGGTQGTTTFVTGLMNQVITLYANENINCSLKPLNLWTSSSPYSGSTSSAMLSQFQNNNNSWEGTLAQLLSYKASGGIAAGFSGLCNSNRDNSMSFSNIQSTYSNVPTYSWSVMVVTHEFGHLFGSRHTHACVWNGNNTAIDGCAGSTEGSCSNPGNPSGGGTIMSYCHLTSAGINFNNGFGTQPGNVIRNRVSNASCTVSCDGGGDDGGDDTCTDNEVTVTVTTDNYPSETSWTIKDSDGTTVASGGSYSSQGTAYNTTACLPDGCYTFTINDSYGDGLCCSYGNGSYSVTGPDGSVASGGSFSSSESTEFCLGDSNPGDTQAPTAPTNLSASNTTTTTTTLSWSASSDNVGVTGYTIYSNGNSIGNVTATSANITGLTPATTYSYYVRAYDEAGNYSSNSNTVAVTTDSEDNPPVSYCSLSGNNSNYEWIDLVRLNNLDNPSGNDGGYEDNTNMVANLPYGSNRVYMSAGFSGSSYTEYWSVWIDYNQDGTFQSSERVVSGSSSSSATLQATFSVPTSAASGNTRMRVAMKYNTSNASSCGTFSYGEVEDYTVNIGGSSPVNLYGDVDASDLKDEELENYKIYPNPASTDYVTVDMYGVEKATFNVVNTMGQVVTQGALTQRSNRIDISEINSGMYMINLYDGQKTVTKKVIIQ